MTRRFFKFLHFLLKVKSFRVENWSQYTNRGDLVVTVESICEDSGRVLNPVENSHKYFKTEDLFDKISLQKLLTYLLWGNSPGSIPAMQCAFNMHTKNNKPTVKTMFALQNLNK